MFLMKREERFPRCFPDFLCHSSHHLFLLFLLSSFLTSMFPPLLPYLFIQLNLSSFNFFPLSFIISLFLSFLSGNSKERCPVNSTPVSIWEVGFKTSVKHRPYSLRFFTSLQSVLTNASLEHLKFHHCLSFSHSFQLITL